MPQYKGIKVENTVEQRASMLLVLNQVPQFRKNQRKAAFITHPVILSSILRYVLCIHLPAAKLPHVHILYTIELTWQSTRTILFSTRGEKIKQKI
mmetsp:Transcript_23299/g.33893  ORF Transcript_23299/g.33893 Transcript_23299/m.33893 type:complete len:95 (+) Transcript_23299:1040-1324(+)